MKCPNCKKSSGFYICSDSRNAWCRYCDSYYAHFDGILLYLGNDERLRNCVREDLSIVKVTRKVLDNKTIIEEERLFELENKFKELIKDKVHGEKLLDESTNRWHSLSKTEKVNLFLSKSDIKKD
jgi:hypothetical protein